jgi:hypothetical protein
MQGIKYKLRGENHTQRNCKLVHRHRTSKTDIAVFINFEDLVRHVQGRKSWKSEAPSSAGYNASKIDEFEDPYKEIWQKHWAMCSLKSALDRLQRRSRTGITHSIGLRWQCLPRMKCEIKLCLLLIIDHIKSVFKTLLMFACANILHFHFASISLSSSTLC